MSWWDILDIHVTGSDWWNGRCTRIYISSPSQAMYMADLLPPCWDIHPEVHAMLDSMKGTDKGSDVPMPRVYHRRNRDNDDLIDQPYLITFVVDCVSKRVSGELHA